MFIDNYICLNGYVLHCMFTCYLYKCVCLSIRTVIPQSCWKCRTNLEKVLSVFLVLAVTAAIALLVVMSMSGRNRKSTYYESDLHSPGKYYIDAYSIKFLFFYSP